MEDYFSGAESDFTDESVSGVTKTSKRNSFVWDYFRAVRGGATYECLICYSCVTGKTSNLSRHLVNAHDITKERTGNSTSKRRDHPNKSFVWEYCTREDIKHARCKLCKKLLFCGSGNTSNIAKHLERRHHGSYIPRKNNMKFEDSVATESVNGNSNVVENDLAQGMSIERKERKGASYVWNYCDKLSRNTIRCNLCQKLMSFHGTANVITHLQRKHNILGKAENSNNISMDGDAHSSIVSEENQQTDDAEATTYLRKRFTTPSIVWKYCIRLDAETVRCKFCKKNLSYRGTSNLQRHLHRMHGVATQTRVYKDQDVQSKQLNSDFIFEHCTLDEKEDKIKCNMCNTLFPSKDPEEIGKHLTTVHSIVDRPQGRKRKLRKHYDSSDESSDVSDDIEIIKNEDEIINLDFEEYNKKDDILYDDIIQEDQEHIKADEEPFDPNDSQNIALANPLSPRSSRASPDIIKTKRNNIFFSKKLQELNEELVRTETEYFREKAGYYRMQKYLAALQAKKVRIEIERLNNSEFISMPPQQI